MVCYKSFPSVAKIWLNIPLEPSLWIRKRSVIKSVIDITKNQCDDGHSKHRSPFNVFVNLLTSLLAYSFRVKKPKTSINLEARLLPQSKSLMRVA